MAIRRGSRSRAGGWRGLIWFWVVVIVAALAGAGTLEYLGPPEGAAVVAPSGVAAARPPDRVAGGSSPAPASPASASPLPTAPAPGPAALAAPHPPGAPILPPDPALLEPGPGGSGSLPRIGADGRMPMRVYAAGHDPADHRPRVAILLAGIGLNAQDTEEAIRTLPAAVSLAVSPYAPSPGRLLDLARAGGHELLISIPMEPQGYPNNDPGPLALMTGLAPAENAARLDRVLALWGGYAGATGALGNGLRGERYAASGQIAPMLRELARRGVFYIDPRPGGRLPATAPAPASRAVDVVLDEPPLRSAIEARLGQLLQLAQDRGGALGLAEAPSPVTLGRIAAWTTALARHGVVLVPVSALVGAPSEEARP